MSYEAAFTIASVLRFFDPAQTQAHFQLRLSCVYAASMLRLRPFDEMSMFNFPASVCSNFMVMSRVQPIMSHRYVPYCRGRDSLVISRIPIVDARFFAIIHMLEFRVHLISYK
jgi:hypothetical protein